jgi:hypothetical protein
VRFLLLLLLAACSSDPNPPPSPMTGHFVAPNPFPSQGYFISLSLRTTGSTVTGEGWLSGLVSPVLPVTVNGHFENPDFTLALSSGPTPQGIVTGTVLGAGVAGTYTRGPGTLVQLVFTRVDTASTGVHAASISGDFLESVAAAAGFAVQFSRFSLILAYPNRDFPVLTVGWDGTRPGRGTYGFGTTPGFGGQVAPAYAPNQRLFSIVGGSVRIDVSTAYAIIGELQIQTEEPGTGAIANISATFSAGCATQTCQ